MERKYRVYRYQNLVVPTRNYIGKTCRKYQSTRAGKNGRRYLELPKFGPAIIQYGWPNFQYSVLADNLTKEEADELEQYYIEYYDSINQGYNLSTGGAGRPGVSIFPSEETKKRMSMAQKGHFVSEETKINLSKSHKGKKQSTETRRKRANSHGINKILQYTLDGQFVAEYYSLFEASQQTGISKSSISHCCNGITKKAGNHLWYKNQRHQ